MVVGLPPVARAGGLRVAADRFVRESLSVLKLDPELTPLRYSAVVRTPFGDQVLYQQRFGNRRISKGWLRVDFDRDGVVGGYRHELVTAAAARRMKAAESVTAQEAQTYAVTGLLGSMPNGDPVRRFLRHNGGLFACWKVPLAAARPRNRWEVYVDSATGVTLRTESIIQRDTGQGRVFDPNPMVALNMSSWPGGTAIPSAAYREVVLDDLDDGTAYLDGRFITTDATPANERLRRPSQDFRVTQGERGFGEAMSYYHITSAARFLQGMNFGYAVPNPRIRVNTMGPTNDSSSYDHGTRTIELSRRGFADGEDADIILHEYGHAVQNVIYPGFGLTSRSRPIAEGFADYFAASFSDAAKGSAFRPGVASWDACGDGALGVPPFLRRLDFAGPFSPVHPKTIEYWSGSLWAIRGAFNRFRGDVLAMGSLYYVPADPARYADAAWAVIAANRYYFQGADETALIALFQSRGIDPLSSSNAEGLPPLS